MVNINTIEFLGEFNVRNWDGSVDRVEVATGWDEKEGRYLFLVRYPDGVVHHLTRQEWEDLRPKKIRGGP